MRRAHLARAGALAGVVLVAACGAPAPSTAPPSTAATPEPATTVPASPGPSPTVAPASPSAGGPVEDPSLIAVLPADVDGTPVALESLAFTEALADAGFVANIGSAAFAVVVAGDDLASAVVARPLDGKYSERWFRDWRDAYNDGACAQAGGMARNAEAEIGGRTVHIGTCSGGLHTYHAWIEERGLLVSAFSVGEDRFGERLMAGLRP